MADRKQRQKELEEKKKKLEEYRKNKGKAPELGIDEPKTGGEPALNLQTISNLDDLLTNLNKVIPASSPQIPSANSTELTPAVSDVSSPVSSHSTVERRRPQLTLQMNVSVVDIPPKVVEVYSKNTQTSETSFSDEPSQQAGVTTFKHAESSQQASNQDDDEEKEEEIVQVEEPVVKTLSQAEKEQILSSKEFSSFLDHSSRLIERAIYVDTKYDISIDFARTEVNDSKDERAKEVRLSTKYFDDRWSKHRAITDIAWSPKHNDLIVASYSMNEDNTTDPDGVVLVWSLQNTLQRPEYRFHCQSPVTSAFFSPFSPTLIVGGTYSGQVVLWDIRAKSSPVQQTPLSSVGHTHPVFSMNVVGTTNAHSLVSVSTDGKLCVWSLDNLYQPQETLDLHNKASKVVTTSSVPVAVTSLSFPEGEVNELYVGSEEGAIFQCFRYGAKSGVHERFDGHRGPITSVDFHPANGPINFSHLFLSSSTDWTAKLWNPKLGTKPVYSFEDASDYIYDVKWCPTHPSVFASCDGTGSLDLWNLNEETDVPTIKTPVSGNALSKLVWSSDGKKILTGDSNGHLYLYDVGENTTPHPDEWQRFEDTVQRLSAVGQTEEAPATV